MQRILPIFFFLTLFIATVSLFSYWIYQYGGLKQYLSVTDAIRALPVSEQAQARENFYGSEDPWLYGGTLMWANTRGKGGVWVWGEKGPKYFKADENSVFSYWNACGPEIAKLAASGELRQLERTVDEEVHTWRDRVKQGDWTTIVLADGTKNTLRESYAYDKWLFMREQKPCLELTK